MQQAGRFENNKVEGIYSASDEIYSASDEVGFCNLKWILKSLMAENGLWVVWMF